MHEAFAGAYAVTGDAKYSAVKAGFTADHGYKLLQDRDVSAAVEARRIADDIYANAGPAVAREHVRRLLDTEASHREFAALVAPFNKRSAVMEALSGKQPHEMTKAELDHAIDTLKRVAIDKASPVLELSAAPGVFE